MRKTVITEDSGCNPRNIINMIPCQIIDTKNISYYDTKRISDNKNKVITSSEIFDRIYNGEKFHTGSPSISDYSTLMLKYLEEDYDIVHLSMSSAISGGSYNSSMVAREMLNYNYGEDRIKVVDTLNIGSGGTVITDYANYLASLNIPSKEIVKELEEVKNRIISTYYISQVKGFVSSGRAPKVAGLSDKMSFRFRIDVNNEGKFMPRLPVYRGGIKSQFLKFLKSIINEETINNYDPEFISLNITKLKEIDIEEAKEYINSFNYFESKVEELNFYSAITAYGVEDQVGIGLIKKK